MIARSAPLFAAVTHALTRVLVFQAKTFKFTVPSGRSVRCASSISGLEKVAPQSISLPYVSQASPTFHLAMDLRHIPLCNANVIPTSFGSARLSGLGCVDPPLVTFSVGFVLSHFLAVSHNGLIHEICAGSNERSGRGGVHQR